MYTSKTIDGKDAGIYLQGQLVCVVPTEVAEIALEIKNFWLEKERAAYENLGHLNNWSETPPLYRACVEAGHERTDYGPSNNKSGEHVVYCDLCKITWKYDTSD